MRRLNREWMEVMENFVNTTVGYLTDSRLWAYQGGNIVMAQIENELNENQMNPDHVSGEDGLSGSQAPATLQDYANWCGKVASQAEPHTL